MLQIQQQRLSLKEIYLYINSKQTMLLKRLFDFSLSIVFIVLFFPLLLVLFVITSIDTRSFGLFFQERIGQHSKIFWIIKFKTFKNSQPTNFGKLLRRSKLDELPQLFNILIGQMSFVGPRPDIAGYYDTLIGDYRKILLLKPGLTSIAAIQYFNEEELLSLQLDPNKYNYEVIFPNKVLLNLEYFYKRTLWLDFKILIFTFKIALKKGICFIFDCF